MLWRFMPAALWAGLIYFLSSRHALPGWLSAISGGDKVVHAGVYGVLCMWLLVGARGPRTKVAWMCALVTSLYGVSDEYHQGFVVGRSQDVWDWVADTTGALLCVGLWHACAPQIIAAWQRCRRVFKGT